MWCTLCGQDVPGRMAPDRTYRCSRCGGSVPAPSARPQDAPPGREGGKQASNPPGPSDAGLDLTAFDEWEFEEQFREFGQVLKPPLVGNPEERLTGSAAALGTRTLRIDSAHALPDGRHQPLRKDAASAEPVGHGSILGAASWLALSAGTMALVCGGVLLGWSIIGQRGELWTIGLPIALAGQIGLVVGLLFQLDRIWRDHRSAAAKLDEVDQKLHDLKSTTTLLGTAQSNPATAFYCHMAEGAPPTLLLSDLKSQLDLLAVKLSRES